MRGVPGLRRAERARALHRAELGWFVVVLVLVTVVSTTFNWAFVDRRPEDPVRSWLGGIQDGRSRQLLSYAEEVRADPTLGIFSNRVYRGAAGRISGHEILDVRPDGDLAEVRARVWWDDPGGGPRREEVHGYAVHRVERTGPLNDRWELDSPDAAVVSVHLPATLDELSVNGESLRPAADRRVPDPEGPGGTWRFEALPGDYAIGLPGNSYYRVVEPPAPRTVAFRDPQPVSVALDIEPSPRLWEETDQRIQEWLRGCTGADDLAPEGCPASRRYTAAGEPLVPSPTPGEGPGEGPGASLPPGREGAQITDVRWRLVSRPGLVLVQDEGDPLLWRADPWRPAVAELTYREDGERVVERIEFPLRASVRSTGRSAEFSVGTERAG